MSAKFTAPNCLPRRLPEAAVALLLVAGVSAASAQPTATAPAAAPDTPTPATPAAGAAAPTATTADDNLDFAVATPTDWEEDADLAVSLRQHFRETVGLDEYGELGGAAAYIAAGTGALYITWIKTKKPTEDGSKALRAALDQLRAEPLGSALTEGAVEELEYNERMNKEAVEARMAWRHKENETLTISRALAWQNKDKLLRVVRAECIYAESEKARVTPMCQQALVSLASREIDDGHAIALVGLARPNAADAVPKTDGTDDEPGPSLGPVDRKTPLVINNDAPKPRDRKTLWIFIIGAGLVAFAFYSVLQSKRGKKDDDEDEDEDDDRGEAGDDAEDGDGGGDEDGDEDGDEGNGVAGDEGNKGEEEE